MEKNINLIGYHSTSRDAAMSILSCQKFQQPKMSEDDPPDKIKRFFNYWLGTGVYFFEDVDVAKWWSEKPSRIFGEEGDHVILKAEINGLNVVDLRKVSEWRKIVKGFETFVSEVGQNFIADISEDSETADGQKYIDKKHKLRCLFFNWYKSTYGIDVLIAAFNQDEFQYIDKGKYKIENFLDILLRSAILCL